ncbi:Holliday junction branch migration protein RuvA [Virgibacillus sp. W0181]|uniref:Holliday junction branch migration protein RuvA n=1 Tax=Virgibacillus sp. W0181 TaxID=3391581 RepID=UPI003F462038
MIAYIRGTLTFIYEETITVDVNGVGYEILCADPYVFQPLLNKEILIYTYHHVREDAQHLYGFETEDEKFLFVKLISVSGIGPKSGIAILGSVDVDEFIQAIEQEDDKYLTKFPGVGKKTARQIILDLKGKLTGLLRVANIPVEDKEANTRATDKLEEAFAALKALGYSEREIGGVKSQLIKTPQGSTDEIIRNALALLMKN